MKSRPFAPTAVAAIAALLTSPAASQTAELFHLRSECARFAASLEEFHKPSPPWDMQWSSHYNTADGHCYMLVESAKGAGGDSSGWCLMVGLTDAQERRMIATGMTGQGCGSKNGANADVGMMHGSSLNASPIETFAQVSRYIDEKMQR
jgi:hypothetical protein